MTDALTSHAVSQPTRMRRSLVVLLLLSSCAPAPREASPPHEPAASSVVTSDASPSAVEDAGAATDASLLDAGAPAVEAVTGSCPTAYGKGGAACTPTGKKCDYPEGTCTCAPAHYCGGPPPPPDLLAELAVPRWLCEPSPKVIGPDGCPLGMPSGACSTPGKKCRYMPCCAVTMTCTGGKWVPGGMTCPP